MAKKATEFVQFKLRIRESVRRKIEREARSSGASANATAVALLENALQEEDLAVHNDKLLDLLVGGTAAGAVLLRFMMFELQKNPTWDRSPELRKKISDSICGRIASLADDDFYNSTVTHRGNTE